MQNPNQPKVSIVLPVYNAGHYLHKCLQSLIGQTLKEIEIIVVLDCPTDGSDRTAKEYALLDRRIRIIENEKNLRVGLSRNKGIEAATGEYVGFCDHDDYVTPDMFERLYRAVQKGNSDIAICNIDCVWADGEFRKFIQYPSTISPKELKDNLQEAALRFYAKEDPGYGKFIWNMLFKKAFLDEHDIRFGDNRTITSDDCLLLSKAYFFTDGVIHCGTERGLYKHVGHTGSTQTSYAWLNIQLVCNYITDLSAFLHTQKANERQLLLAAEGTVRQLYTGFRKELHFKGWIYACRQACQAARNQSVHTMLRPLFSTPEGLKYALRTLPPTKLLFACFVYLTTFNGKDIVTITN